MPSASCHQVHECLHEHCFMHYSMDVIHSLSSRCVDNFITCTLSDMWPLLGSSAAFVASMEHALQDLGYDCWQTTVGGHGVMAHELEDCSEVFSEAGES